MNPVPAVLTYCGATIRDRGEMLCLTDMWRASGADDNKRPVIWLRQDGPREFIGFIADHIEVIQDHLVITERGGDAGGATWAHWQVGLAYAKYLSPEFHVWCNQVVRSHMERRSLPVQSIQGAVTISPGDLERFAEKVGEGAIKAAHEFLAEGVRRTVEPRFDKIEKRLERIERALPSRRRISEATKQEHLDAIRRLGGVCPCCSENHVIDGNGEKSPFADYDHFYQNSRPDDDHTWFICRPCHTGFTSGRVARRERTSEFDAYQSRRLRLPGRQARISFEKGVK